MWDVKAKTDISNNRGRRNGLKINQTIPEQHIGKARNQGTTENSHFAHCLHTSESNNATTKYSTWDVT